MIAVLKLVAGSMFTSLVTEKFIKWFLLFLVERYVKSTESKVDDALFSKVKEALK